MRWQARSFSQLPRTGASTSTPRRPSPTGASSPPTPTARVYAFGAGTGNLLWARHVGTYVYTAPAVWNRKVYVGTYDGKFYALDAATGDTRWVREMPAAVHGAPTVMAGLVYFVHVRLCGQHGVRYAKQGPNGTYALDARTGKLVWSFPDGQYSPVVADSERVYIVGATPGLRLDPVAKRSSPLSEQERAIAIPVSGQTRYDVWKTRAMKSRTKIETAKPAAASQSRPERRADPDEPGRHRQPDERARAARTGRRRSGRRSRRR